MVTLGQKGQVLVGQAEGEGRRGRLLWKRMAPKEAGFQDVDEWKWGAAYMGLSNFPILSER